MAEEIDSHVDRASKIIHHMRQFGRKSEVTSERVQVNEVLRKALDIFSQQLKLREIEVVRDVRKISPPSWAIPIAWSRCSSICSSMPGTPLKRGAKKRPSRHRKAIYVKTWLQKDKVIVEVKDSGLGIPQESWIRSSNLFSPPSRWARGPGWGFPSAMASSRIMKGRFG